MGTGDRNGSEPGASIRKTRGRGVRRREKVRERRPTLSGSPFLILSGT